MYSIIETPLLFAKYVRDYWSEDEFGEFAHYIARNPDAGAAKTLIAIAAKRPDVLLEVAQSYRNL